MEINMGLLREAYFDVVYPLEVIMIVVVGSKDNSFSFMGDNKERFFNEGDPNNYYYNELCGHKYILDHFDRFKNDAYVGVEHYRRAFDYSDSFIKELLNVYDIIVKTEHGPYGTDTNLSVLSHCSRHGLNYLEHATQWVERFPELRQQAMEQTHFGCNMFLCRPKKFKEMMEEEFAYIDEMMKTPGLQQSEISYFCETILTPHIIKKHNKNICVGRVKTFV